jgi:hypothetical protein
MKRRFPPEVLQRSALRNLSFWAKVRRHKVRAAQNVACSSKRHTTPADGYVASDAIPRFFAPRPRTFWPWSLRAGLPVQTPRATGRSHCRDMSDLARFNAACDALRAKLQLMKYGGHIHHDGEPSAVGLAALRVVLQRSCQADQAVLSARPDAPDRCYVVTCDASASWNVIERSSDEHATQRLYAPRLISKECAWHRLLELAEETKAAMDYSFDEEEQESIYHDDEERDTLRLYDDYDGTYEFSVRGYELDGVLEDAETFLDLRSLASLRVVVGPDALCGKMFSAVVALRETKMPRTLYVKAPNPYWSEFAFSRLQVSKSVAAIERRFPTMKRFPADVLKLAATVNVTWHKLSKPRPQKSSGDLKKYMKRAVNSSVKTPCDTAVVTMEKRYNHQNEHTWVYDTVRPLPLVDQADSLAVWGKGMETLSEKVRHELDYRLWLGRK